VLLHGYPEAYHSFDSPSAARQYLADVQNANKPGGGATVGYDPAARADAVVRVTAFLAEYLKAP
jgi:dienelactone hydrolase